MPGGLDVAEPAGELHLGVWRAGEQFPVLAKMAHQLLCGDAAWAQPASARLKGEHQQHGARTCHRAHTSCVLLALIIGEVVKATAIEHQFEGVADAELLEPADVSLYPVDLDSRRLCARSRLAQSLPNTIDSITEAILPTPVISGYDFPAQLIELAKHFTGAEAALRKSLEVLL